VRNLGERIRTGLYVNGPLWDSFKKKVKSQGFSTCFIVETLVRGYMALDSRKGAPLSSVEKIVVNQKIDYVVERPRRVKGFRTPLENCYQNGCWTYRRPETGETLSRLHHVPECSCSVCKPFVGAALRNAQAEKRRCSLKF